MADTKSSFRIHGVNSELALQAIEAWKERYRYKVVHQHHTPSEFFDGGAASSASVVLGQVTPEAQSFLETHLRVYDPEVEVEK